MLNSFFREKCTALLTLRLGDKDTIAAVNTTANRSNLTTSEHSCLLSNSWRALYALFTLKEQLCKFINLPSHERKLEKLSNFPRGFSLNLYKFASYCWSWNFLWRFLKWTKNKVLRHRCITLEWSVCELICMYSYSNVITRYWKFYRFACKRKNWKIRRVISIS